MPRRRAFTLIEALVSIAIAAAMLVMIATIFRQATAVTRQVRSSASIHQVARQIFEQLGRDFAGTSRTGFIVLRAQSRRYSGSPPYDVCLYYDQEGTLERLTDTRTDMIAMLSSGYHTSAVDGGKYSGFSRVIWGQTERVNGADNDVADGRSPTDTRDLKDHPEFWAVNQVLARHQTLLTPDLNPIGTGSNRGPDYYNMSVSDLTGLFWAAMGIYGDKYLYSASLLYEDIVAARGYQGYRNILLVDRADVEPFRPVAKVFRLGRDGPTRSGGAGGQAGGGDLTTGQVHQEPSSVLDSHPDPPTLSMRGYERPRIFGPDDYHRMVAFAVASFQIDWTDGRRDNNDALVFYPADAAGSANVQRRYSYVRGPGKAAIYAWNEMSPDSVRSQYLRMNNWRGLDSAPGKVCAAWVWHSRDTGGVFCPNNLGWARPKAFRVRLVLMDRSTEVPTAFQFVQTFTLLAQ